MSKSKCLLASALAIAAVAAAPAAAAPDKPVKVSADGDGGWGLATDPGNAVPYGFTLAQRTIGGGSLEVPPIAGAPAKKFIATLPLGIPVDASQSLSYDFRMSGLTGPTSHKQFYLNVYAEYPVPQNAFYDCRFDYVPASGSSTSWTTATFAATDIPTAVTTRNEPTPPPVTTPCPATLAGMPAGSNIKFVALNVGDTTAADTGLGGFFDNVVLSAASGSVTYDFDPTKDACKGGGFATGGYKNQGACIAAVNAP